MAAKRRDSDVGPEPVERVGGGLLPFGLMTVAGPSMVPTLLHGDRLVVRYGARLRPGAVVLARHPLRQDLLVVKRATERRSGGWWLLSDNQFVESDSREYGAVPGAGPRPGAAAAAPPSRLAGSRRLAGAAGRPPAALPHPRPRHPARRLPPAQP